MSDQVYVRTQSTVQACPFCGGAPQMYVFSFGNGTGRMVLVLSCGRCAAQIQRSLADRSRPTLLDAIQGIINDWNRRTVVSHSVSLYVTKALEEATHSALESDPYHGHRRKS